MTYFYPRPLRGGRPAVPQAGRPGADISIHALCEEGDPHSGRPSSQPADFYPRPLRGGRPAQSPCGRSRYYFYPRPLRGGRPRHIGIALQLQEFLSTPSARRATLYDGRQGRATGYFYPRPLRGGRQFRQRQNISTLSFLSTPSARRATCFRCCGQRSDSISIHALCEEGDRLRSAPNPA